VSSLNRANLVQRVFMALRRGGEGMSFIERLGLNAKADDHPVAEPDASDQKQLERTYDDALKEARKDAREARRLYWPEEFYPVDMLDVAQRAKLVVMIAAIEDPNFAGYYERGTDTIYVNALSTPQRLRTTMAHEFAHWFDAEVKGRPADSSERRVRRDCTTAGDAYADEFALCFLMPEDFVRKARREHATINFLADTFGVSAESVFNRLYSLRLVD